MGFTSPGSFKSASPLPVNFSAPFLNAIRFGRLAEPGLFSTARIEDSEVVWDDGTVCIRASINELLDSMQMDG